MAKLQLFPEKAIHLTLDLETASLGSNAAIVQLAVVGKDFSFNEYVSLASCEAAGMQIDKETMEWWQTQDAAVRRKVFGGTTHIAVALNDLLSAIGAHCEGEFSNVVLWGNGPEFDNVVLKNAVERYQSWPFYYRNMHSLRTIMAPIPAEVQERFHKRVPENSTKHDALADARYQHRWLELALTYHGVY